MTNDLPPDALRFTTRDDGSIRPNATWLPDDEQVVRARRADEQRGRCTVEAFCPECRHQSIVGKVYESSEGPLYVADPPAIAGVTSIAIEWSRQAGYDGRVPSATEPVRVLVDDPPPGPRGDCIGWCSHHRTRLVVDLEDLRAAVNRYRDDGRRGRVRATRLSSS